MRLFRRRPRERPIGEAEAYHRLHGDRDEVRLVHLPPRPRRFDLDVSGEQLRRSFEARLASREPEEGEEPEEESA